MGDVIMRSIIRCLIINISFFVYLGLTGCTHIEVAAFDKRTNTVSIMGGRHAEMQDYQEAANQYCGGPATLLKMDSSVEGAVAIGNAQTYGSTTYGSATAIPIKRWVYTFSCGTQKAQ